MTRQTSSAPRRLSFPSEIAALGVVFGDIGTSPLYAFRQAAVAAQAAGGAAEAHILGVLSLVFWTLTIVVTVKYVLLVLRADHDGEGGILALLTLLKPSSATLTGRLLILIGLLGAATLLGDGVLTPAISVLSAIEGLEVVAPGLAHLVVPLAASILAVLFAVQRFGTGPIAGLFGPVMLIWFIAIGLAGLVEIVWRPHVLAAVDPRFGVALLLSQPTSALAIMGAVFLAVTGGEALYADLGQFGRPAIQRAWFAVALPALLLNYFGQGALLLRMPEAIHNPFFALVPAGFGIPMLLLATLATVIASQAIITGAFNLTRQAADLGYLPPMRLRYTSPDNERDIYVGRANAMLTLGTLGIVVGFRSSGSLASAYGVAVSITMVATTVLFVSQRRAGHGMFLSLAPLAAVLLMVDLGLMAANLTKIDDGGWLPLGFAATVMLMMVSWHRGRVQMATRYGRRAMPLAALARRSAGDCMIPRTAIFLGTMGDTAPTALATLHELGGVRFAHSVVVTITIANRPRVPIGERVRCTRIGEGLMKIELRFGYMQHIRVPAVVVPLLRETGIEAEKAIYIVGLDHMTGPESIRSMGDLLAKVAAFLARNAEADADRFALPPSRTLVLGRSLRV
jgi:KUP system potassium uptake protein